MASNDDAGESSRDGEQVTETAETSWLSRLARSFAGIIFGILLIVASSVLLFWNEGRAVTTARSLAEGAGLVRTVAADRVDPANEGRLVHVTGALTATGLATDTEFAMKSDGVRLIRHVQMFQWTEDQESETTKKLGGGETTKTTYKYKRDWADKPVDSSKFHAREGHANPQMTWRQRQALAPGIKLGAFAMPDNLMGGFGDEEALTVGDDQVAALQKHAPQPVQAIDGALYVGKDPAQPSVGDYRITFAEVTAQAASVVARQAGPTFEAYRTHAGGTVELIAAGSIPAADMFKEPEDDNRMWTWLIRLGGCVAMFIGFVLIMNPLAVLADVIPLLGDIVGAGTGIVAFLCTVAIAPVVIAVAWFAYRPLVAAVSLVASAALTAGVFYLARQRRARKAAASHA